MRRTKPISAPPNLGGLLPGLGCPLFAVSDASHHSTCLSPDGPTQNSRQDFSFCAGLSEVWSARFRPGIVARHHFTTAVTEGDGSVRVLGHHGSKQPTSNSKPTLRNGAGCLRNSHVAFGDIGGRGGLVSGGYARRVWVS